MIPYGRWRPVALRWFPMNSWSLLLSVKIRNISANHNKAIVNSRLRPQSCCHLANFIEMQEIVVTRIMNNSTYPNNPEEAIFVPVQKCPYHVTFDLDLDLEHTLDACWPGVYRVQVWWRSGHLPARSDFSAWIDYIVTCYIVAWQTYRQWWAVVNYFVVNYIVKLLWSS